MLATVFYLFQSGSSRYYALSIDKTGCNIPRIHDRERWLLRAEIRPEDIEPKLVPAVDCAYDRGFYVWLDREPKELLVLKCRLQRGEKAGS